MKVQSGHNVINAYTIGDVAFSSEWPLEDDGKVWIRVRYAGYSADGSLYFQWSRGGTYYTGTGNIRMPHPFPVQEMRVALKLLHLPIGMQSPLGAADQAIPIQKRCSML